MKDAALKDRCCLLYTACDIQQTMLLMHFAIQFNAILVKVYGCETSAFYNL